MDGGIRPGQVARAWTRMWPLCVALLVAWSQVLAGACQSAPDSSCDARPEGLATRSSALLQASHGSGGRSGAKVERAATLLEDDDEGLVAALARLRAENEMLRAELEGRRAELTQGAAASSATRRESSQRSTKPSVEGHVDAAAQDSGEASTPGHIHQQEASSVMYMAGKFLGERAWWMIITAVIVMSFLLSWAIARCSDDADVENTYEIVASVDQLSPVPQRQRRQMSGKSVVMHAKMLNYLKVDQDGGLDRVGSEFMRRHRMRRYVTVIFLLGGGVANLAITAMTSMSTIDGYCGYIEGAPLEKIHILSLISSVFSELDGMTNVIIEAAVVVSVIELVVGAYALAHIFRLCCTFAWGVSEFQQYDALREMVWEAVPFASSFSAMKVLLLTHPALIGMQLEDQIEEPLLGNGPFAVAFQVCWFALSRVAALAVGTLALIVKIIVIVARLSMMHTYTVPQVLVGICCMAAFVFQMVLIVAVNVQYNDRILRIFFAGADAELEQEEHWFMHVYCVRVVKEIWKSYSVIDRLVLLNTFTHDDFQKLLLIEDLAKKFSWLNLSSDDDRSPATATTTNEKQPKKIPSTY